MPPHTLGDLATLSDFEPHELAQRERAFIPATGSQSGNADASPVQRNQDETASISFTLDLRAITYIDVVDENLICPICRCALVDPVTTDCDHTFCRGCIESSLSHKEICPIDRSPITSAKALNTSPKIIHNQLDNLKAKCPCCETTIPRSMLKHHMEKYCLEAPVICPGTGSVGSCNKYVKKKQSHGGCLHYQAMCPDCQSNVFMIDLEDHRENVCQERQSRCERCGIDVVKCRQTDHNNECPEMKIACRWNEYGCQYVVKRIDHEHHTVECEFRLVGNMGERFKKDISSLQAEVRLLTETNQLQDRRIKFLEKGSHQSDHIPDYHDISEQMIQSISESGNADPLDSAHEYLLSLLEAQESRVSRLSADMTELDSKQTVLLLNETIPIKNELAEIRSNLQVTSMHVRWLMRFRIQENQKRGFGPGPSPGLDTGPSSSSFSPPRRLSDPIREIITKL